QHTPPAPAAGLAALVRQTAAPPVADETRAMRPSAKQVRRQPPNPPPGGRAMTVPGLAPLPQRDPIPPAAPPKAEGSAVRAAASSALPLAPPAPDASPLPIAPARRATPEAAVKDRKSV